ncbi:MAG: hypothetical protein AAF266_08535, partial [Planctomycetota bacterium]
MDSFELHSNGAITDADDSRVEVNGTAVFVVDAALDESTPAAIRLADADSVGDDGQPTNSFRAFGPSSFIVLPTDGVTPGVDVGVNEDGEAAAALALTNGIRFSALDHRVRIADDGEVTINSWSGVLIPSLEEAQTPTANEAAELQLLSQGSIRDAENTVTSLTGDATLVALNGEIRLANENAGNEFSAGGVVTLISGATESPEFPAGPITVGVASATGEAADAIFDAGQLRFYADGGWVRIAEDSDTSLTNWEADTLPALLPQEPPTESLAQRLELSSAGSITDAPLGEDDPSGVAVTVTGFDGTFDSMANATFVAATDIVLADSGAGNQLSVDGISTFVAGDDRVIDVGVDDGVPADATFNTGTLRFVTSEGAVRIAEDSSTVLTNWEANTISPLIGFDPVESTAQTLDLRAEGSISDAKNKPEDTSEVSVQVTTTEDESADATLIATTSIVLADADSADNQLRVDDLATFIAGSGEMIDIGVEAAGTAAAAVFNAGSVRFAAPGGEVRIAEDSGTELAGWEGASIGLLAGDDVPDRSTADTSELRSNGKITDAENAFIEIAGDAAFVVATTAGITNAPPDGPPVQAIVLADSAMAINRLDIGGFAEFVVEMPDSELDEGVRGPKGIDVGVDEDGTPADATFVADSLRFFAPDALVRLAEDNDTQIGGGDSRASELQVRAEGGITDNGDADTEVTTSAELNAQGGTADIVLGDQDARFSMGTPGLFDESMFLAMDALNISVQV